MNDRKAYEKLIEARIKEYETHLRQMEANACRAHAENQLMKGKPLSGFRDKIDTLTEKAEELKNAGDETWQDAKAGVDSILSDLKAVFDSIRMDLQ
jgi:hypothetical protein